MRSEVARKYLRLALLLLIGVALGRFVVPFFEPMTRRYVTLFREEGDEKCHYVLHEEVHVLGKVKTALGSPPTPGMVTWGSYLEGYLSVGCDEQTTYDETILRCRCPRER